MRSSWSGSRKSLILASTDPVLATDIQSDLGAKSDRQGFSLLIGWFGIRGIGSIFYLLLAPRYGVAGDIAETIVSLTTWTVAASIVTHGLTAQPLMRRYHARRERDTNRS